MEEKDRDHRRRDSPSPETAVWNNPISSKSFPSPTTLLVSKVRFFYYFQRHVVLGLRCFGSARYSQRQGHALPLFLVL
uniref:Uncharacterized protein n=1 Tax=Cucumis melo TaxID=3656 RepID=A0A9I9E3S5_CUCME